MKSQENLDASMDGVYKRLAAAQPKEVPPRHGFNEAWQKMLNAVGAFCRKPSAFGESKE